MHSNSKVPAGYNKYTNFIEFLKNNNVFDEMSYNELKQNQQWMIEIADVRTKYPNFCFRDIHLNSLNFYWNKQDAVNAVKLCDKQLINNVGIQFYIHYDHQYKLDKMHKLDNKIPPIDFDLYYPDD